MKRVAIITASSVSGRACAARLAALGGDDLKIRLVFRGDEARGTPKELRDDPRVETLVGVDAADIFALRDSLSGVDSAVLVTPHDASRGFDLDAKLSGNMVRAAAGAGVQRIVHVGSWTVKAPARLPGLASRFQPTEELLAEIGAQVDALEWAVLRGGYFMNNLAAMFGPPLQKGAESIAFPKGVVVAPCDVRDIGDAAAALCLLPRADFLASYQARALECSGPEELDFDQIAEELGKVVGRGLRHREVDLDAWCEGKPPAIQELLRYMVAEGRGAVPFEPETLVPLLRRKPRSLREWAEDHKSAFLAP